MLSWIGNDTIDQSLYLGSHVKEASHFRVDQKHENYILGTQSSHTKN